MQIFRRKHYGLSCSQVWFPKDPQCIYEEMKTHSLVQVFHASFESESCGLAKYCSNTREFWTTVIPLSLSKEDLMQRLEPKSCRYEIRKAEKSPYTIFHNERLDEARQLFDDFIQRSEYRHPLSDEEWDGYRGITNVHSIYHHDQIIATHLVLLDPPDRVRLNMSATLARGDEQTRPLIGPFNRRLHWEEFLYYKALGYAEYDFGGVTREPESPAYQIGKFKLSFGGELRKQNDFLLIKNPAIRIAWEAARDAKARIKRYKSARRAAGK